MRWMTAVVSAVVLLSSMSVTCFALGKFTERESRMSLTLKCVDWNGVPAISVTRPDGGKFVSNNLTLTRGDQSIAITVHDKELEVVIGGQVIRASELRLITNCDLLSIEGKTKK